MTEITDREIVRTMAVLGGSFIHKLAELWALADDRNRARIKATWQDEFKKYAELAERQATQGQETS